MKKEKQHWSESAEPAILERVVLAFENLERRFGNLGNIGRAFEQFGGPSLSAQHIRPYKAAIKAAKRKKGKVVGLEGISMTSANMFILLDILTSRALSEPAFIKAKKEVFGEEGDDAETATEFVTYYDPVPAIKAEK